MSPALLNRPHIVMTCSCNEIGWRQMVSSDTRVRSTPAVGSGAEVVVVLLDGEQRAQDLVAWLPPLRDEGAVCYFLPHKPVILQKNFEAVSGSMLAACDPDTEVMVPARNAGTIRTQCGSGIGRCLPIPVT